MTYTAENIKNIKRDGKFEAYIQMEKDLIQKIESAELVDDGQNMSFAHFSGVYSADKQDLSPNYFCARARYFQEGFDKEWNNFQSLNAATQYARAALRNHIMAQVNRVLGKARERLAQLEAAR